MEYREDMINPPTMCAVTTGYTLYDMHDGTFKLRDSSKTIAEFTSMGESISFMKKLPVSGAPF
jgi:hypothetical protein